MGVPIIGADSRLDDASPAATSVSPSGAVGFPKENLTDDRIFTLYKMSTSTSPLDIKTDAGVGNTAVVSYFFAVGHNFKSVGDAPPVGDNNGAVDINFAFSDDDVAYTTIFSITGVADDRIIARRFTLAAPHRFYRLRVTRASSFIVSIGQVGWGQAVVFPFGMPVGFDPNAETLNARSNISQTGNIVGAAVLFTQRRVSVSLELQPSTFVDDATIGGFREFWDKHGQLMKPFLFMWNAENLATDTTFEKDSVFGVIAPGDLGRPLTTQLATGFRDLSFEIVALKELV